MYGSCRICEKKEEWEEEEVEIEENGKKVMVPSGDAVIPKECVECLTASRPFTKFVRKGTI